MGRWKSDAPGLQGETSFMLLLKEITMLFRTLTAAAILVLGITAAQADDLSQVSAYVTFGDLNLSQPADAKILADRLEDAAKSVCLKANPDLDSSALMQQCIDSAISMGMTGIQDRLDQEVSAKLVVVRTSLTNP
jgi:UrcA family protein